MSLRGFHIFFITLSVLLSFGFAAFEFLVFRQGHATLDAVIGGFSAAAGLALAVYGTWFLKKARRLSL